MRSAFETQAVHDAAEPHQLKKLILKLRWVGLYPEIDLTGALPLPWQCQGPREARAKRG